MNIEVKNYKRYPALSEETEAYSATVYIDGKRAGEARNDGHGGSARIDIVPEHAAAFREYARRWGEGNGETFEPEDALLRSLCEESELRKDLRKWQKRDPRIVAGVAIWKDPEELIPGDPSSTFYNVLEMRALTDVARAETVAVEAGAGKWRLVTA